MHKSRIGEITIDCQTGDLDSAAAFWSAVLGLRATKFENYYLLETEPNDLKINIQTVEHESRVHIDLETDDIEAEVRRLERLGAKRIRDGRRWVVMQTPTGHGICVCNPQRADFETAANSWSD